MSFSYTSSRSEGVLTFGCHFDSPDVFRSNRTAIFAWPCKCCLYSGVLLKNSANFCSERGSVANCTWLRTVEKLNSLHVASGSSSATDAAAAAVPGRARPLSHKHAAPRQRNTKTDHELDTRRRCHSRTLPPRIGCPTFYERDQRIIRRGWPGSPASLTATAVELAADSAFRTSSFSSSFRAFSAKGTYGSTWTNAEASAGRSTARREAHLAN